jgi:hypothetical protein
MWLGFPETNLRIIDPLIGRDGERIYARRVHITTDGSTSSSHHFVVRLPSWFDGSFGSSDNIHIDMYKIDGNDNITVTLTVYDDAGDPDDGVNGVSIDPVGDEGWETFDDELTETNYVAGALIRIEVALTLVDKNDEIWIGPCYIDLN